MAKKTIDVFIKVDSDGDHCIGRDKDDVHAAYEAEYCNVIDSSSPPVFKIYKVTAEVEVPDEEVELSAMPVAVG